MKLRATHNRLKGGLVERGKPLGFSFDGRKLIGLGGDTLASALMANGIRLVGRSFKYHRPRGVFTAGPEEPNALVELRSGARREPNTKATTVELYDGLVARSQNRFPSLGLDVMAVNDLFSPFLTAGFYYKTFMWPPAFWEKVYEPLIRRAAGLGRASGMEDPDTYDKGYLHCDILIIGAGPAGLAAALRAGRSGVRVILVEEDYITGGRLNAESGEAGGSAARAWAQAAIDELRSMDNARVMLRSAAIGAYDHGIYGVLERVGDHLAETPRGRPRQIMWQVYSKLAVYCGGATERSIAFGNNDRPGIMLAGALRGYANRWAVTPASRIAVFTNNDSGHRTALDMINKGVEVAAVIDTRPDARPAAEYEVIPGGVVTDTKGRAGLQSITVNTGGVARQIKCGALGVSGGWNPNIHLACHHGARPEWDETIAAFVAGNNIPPGMSIAGAAAGIFSTRGAITSGDRAAGAAVRTLGKRPAAASTFRADNTRYTIEPFWYADSPKRAWIDLQNDVTVKDIKLAHQENFTSVEHLKRYTTLGMATDQGKTSNVLGLAVMADTTGKSIPETGTTIYRPPYAPVAIGAFGARTRGREFRPTRLAPSHAWAQSKGAVFIETGMWMRAQWFPREGEAHWRESVDREVLATRNSVGVCDVSTLGKIDVQGKDAGAFLDMVYCNGFSTLATGRVRYGLMLREDGMVMDDGTAARMARDHFIVTTTTANAVEVYRHMEFVRQCLVPDMDVQLISTTDAWAQFSVAGPYARDLIRKLVDRRFDVSNKAFPYMACRAVTVCGGMRARLFRISFSGELAYEIAVPARYGDGFIRALMEAGREWEVTPYGIEALGVMRIEKGHPAGPELNGTTTALNLGMERMMSKSKDFIGKHLAMRPELVGGDVLNLVGLKPIDPRKPVTSGGHLIAINNPVDAAHDEGFVTSACYSPMLGSHIGLGLLRGGAERIGESFTLVSTITGDLHEVEVTSPHFFDETGERLRV